VNLVADFGDLTVAVIVPTHNVVDDKSDGQTGQAKKRG